MGPEEGVVAVVLAGGAASDRLAAEFGVAAKALVPLAGQPLAAYVLRALQDSGVVDHVVYVGPTDAGLEGLYDRTVSSGDSLLGSLSAGLKAALNGKRAAGPLLLVTADLPWVTGEVIARFVGGALKAEQAGEKAALVYPVISELASREQFPDQRRTYARLREGRFTGGNAVLIDPEVVPALLPLIDRVYRARKNPLALASIVGIDVLVAVLLGRANLPGLERRVAKLLGAPVRALVTDDAALAADIDEPSQLPSSPPTDVARPLAGG